jgi:hypothetical protein
MDLANLRQQLSNLRKSYIVILLYLLAIVFALVAGTIFPQLSTQEKNAAYN